MPFVLLVGPRHHK